MGRVIHYTPVLSNMPVSKTDLWCRVWGGGAEVGGRVAGEVLRAVGWHGKSLREEQAKRKALSTIKDRE